MNRLSLKICETFFKFFLPQILTVGLVEPLKEFSAKTSGPLGEAIKSLYVHMKNGESIQDAICNMSPRFPVCIEELFILAVEQSILDEVLDDIIKIYEGNDSEEVLYTELSLLIDRLYNRPSSDFICLGCFERAFEKIVKRAIVEDASEVIFKQEEERFLHQKYLGVKVIQIIEPCHSKLYKTLFHKLTEYSESNRAFKISLKKYSVEKVNENQFRVASDGYSLTFVFKS